MGEMLAGNGVRFSLLSGPVAELAGLALSFLNQLRRDEHRFQQVLSKARRAGLDPGCYTLRTVHVESKV